MDDLVGKLRAAARAELAKAPPLSNPALPALLNEAADEIQWLNLRILRLEGMA